MLKFNLMDIKSNLVKSGSKWLADIIKSDNDHTEWVVLSNNPFSDETPIIIWINRHEDNILSSWYYDLSDFDDDTHFESIPFNETYEILSDYMKKANVYKSHMIQNREESVNDFMYKCLAIIGDLKNDCCFCGTKKCVCSSCDTEIRKYTNKNNEKLDLILLGCWKE